MKQQPQNAEHIKTSIGGQALMEGIMMRGPKMTAMAVRNPKGEIVIEKFPTVGAKRPKICRLPVIRGVFGYIDSMRLGYKCLMRSAEISALDEIVEKKPKDKEPDAPATDAQPAPEAISETAVETPPEAISEPALEAPAADAVTPDEKPDVPAEKAEVSDEKNKTEEKKSEKSDPQEDESKLPSWVATLIMVVSAVLAVVLALGLFLYLPMKLYQWTTLESAVESGVGSVALRSLIKSVFLGVIKILLLVGYMALISLEKDIRRTFMFHGAEHKTIFCYEAGLDLTVENIRKMRRFHPRCGTSFLILMLLVSIFVGFFIDPVAVAISGHTLAVWMRLVVNLLLIPIIVGLGYELIKLAGRHDNWFTRVISAPGVALQHITVFEPTDDMIECAIAAVSEVIPNDGSDKW